MDMIESDAPIRSSLELVIAEYLKSEQDHVGPVKRWLLRFNRWRIQICLAGFQGFHLTRAMEFVEENQLNFRERWQRFMKQGSSSKFHLLVVGSLVVSSVLTIINLYFHYAYDFNLALLREIYKRANAEIIDRNNTSELVADIEHRAQVTRLRLKSFGSAHVEWLFVAQMIDMLFWFYSILYVIGTAYVRYRDQDYFSWLRWVLDEEAECKSRAQLTLMEMAKMQRAMILASEIEFEELEDFASGISDSSRFDPHLDGPQFKDALQFGRRGRRQSSYVLAEIDTRSESVRRRHQTLLELFKQVALAGRLNPLNRTRRSIGSLEMRMYILDSIQVTLFISHAIFTYNYFKHLLARNGSHVEYTSARDYLQTGNFAYPIVLCYIAIIPMTSFNFVTGHDQAQSVSKLKSLIMETISSNEIIYRNLMFATPKTNSLDSSVRKLMEKLELNLMSLLMQYRLFAVEYKLALRPFQYFGAVYVSLIFVVPLLIRGHSPYMLDDMKPFLCLVGLFHLIPSLLFFLPLCHVHRKCIEIYKLLNILIAQSVEYALIPALSDCPTLNNFLSQIRRELSEPEKALDKFSCRVVTQEITYASMLRMIYWVGLIQFPILSRSKSDDIMGQFLGDPFGIFKVLD